MEITKPTRRSEKGLTIVTVTFLMTATILSIIGLVRVVPSLLSWEHTSVDFRYYFVAAQALDAGRSPYGFGYLYPPFFAGLLRSLTALDFPQAARIWFAINALTLIPIAYLFVKLAVPQRKTALLIVPAFVGILLIPATYETLLLGQVNLLVVLCVLGSLSFVQKERRSGDVIAGMLLGVAIAIKIFPMFLVASLVWRRKKIAIGSVVLATLLTILIGVLLGGSEYTVDYFVNILPNLSTQSMITIENQSLTGYITRLFSGVSQSFPLYSTENYVNILVPGIIDLPWLGYWLSRLFSLLTFVVSNLVIILGIRRMKSFPLWIDFSVLTSSILLFSPIVWDAYYTLLLIPLIALLLWGAPQKPILRMFGSLSILLIIIQRFWRPLIVNIPSIWITGLGFFGVLIIWTMVVYCGFGYLNLEKMDNEPDFRYVG